MNKEELYLAEDNLAAEIEEISEFVFNHAELGSEEFKSCKYLVEKLKEHGFTVTCPYLVGSEMCIRDRRQPVVNVILPTVAVMMISTLHFSSTQALKTT